jgi:AraC-like DNA-binding protein
MEGIVIFMDDPMISDPNFLKDGFAGQQIIVLPRPVVSQASRHPLLKGLQVTDAGFFPWADAHGIERRKGSKGAILIVCREGNGWLRLGGPDAPVQAVGPGDALLIAPGQPHSYGAARKNPWTIQWVHFIGEEMADWWCWHGWPARGGVWRLAAGDPELLDLGRIHENLARGYDERRLIAAAAALRWVLAHLGSATSAESGEGSRQAIEGVEAWMRERIGAKVSLGQLAGRARLSPPHFASLFRKRFGFAPIDYFLRLKISRACNLLDTTDWPVSRVATEVGIEDPLYFSRRFRVVMGVSPRDYRRSKKG